jgi:3'-phosphoadenosine 5'-phosphosulfate (PAPS) 3'-phosphatase
VHVTKIKAWDICAADAVVWAAGGKFTDLKGRPIMYSKSQPVNAEGIIAASDPHAHDW